MEATAMKEIWIKSGLRIIQLAVSITCLLGIHGCNSIPTTTSHTEVLCSSAEGLAIAEMAIQSVCIDSNATYKECRDAIFASQQYNYSPEFVSCALAVAERDYGQ